MHDIRHLVTTNITSCVLLLHSVCVFGLLFMNALHDKISSKGIVYHFVFMD